MSRCCEGRGRSRPPTAPARCCSAWISSCPRARSPRCSVATAWARPRRCARSSACTPSRRGADPLRRRARRRPADRRDRAPRHRPRTGGTADLSQPHRARESRGLRRNRSGSRDPWTLERVFALFPPLAARADGHGRTALRRRTADARHRPRADDQSAPADPGRSHRGPRAAGARRDLALPRRAQGRGTDDPRDRQVRRAPDRVADHHTIIERGRVVWQGIFRPSSRRDPALWHRYLGI